MKADSAEASKIEENQSVPAVAEDAEMKEGAAVEATEEDE